MPYPERHQQDIMDSSKRDHFHLGLRESFMKKVGFEKDLEENIWKGYPGAEMRLRRHSSSWQGNSISKGLSKV